MAIERTTRTITSSKNVRPRTTAPKHTTTHRPSSMPSSVTASRSVTNYPITSNARSRVSERTSVDPIMASLSPEKRQFARQMQATTRKMQSINAATNTTNIAARPDFLELLPLFTQKLLILDVFGSIPMKSRQQVIPYFKFVSENDKGNTKAGTILASPFANRQGLDPDYGSRTVRNEIVGDGDFSSVCANYYPILPGSVTVYAIENGESTPYVDDGNGILLDGDGNDCGYINYSNGCINLSSVPAEGDGNCIKCTYQYDNETVGPDEDGHYGARMAKGELQLDEFNLIAEAHEIACYSSLYSAFVAQQEWGTNIDDLSKEAAIGELTAEINSQGFRELKRAATINPNFNWDAAPVMNGSVVPSDYLNMFKLKLSQASNAIYQRTRLSRPNRIIMGTNVASYIQMVQGFNGASVEDTVGPYKLGTLDMFEMYVDPNYDPNEWVMCCKNNDIRRNSGIYGEYMPLTSTDVIGLADMSRQVGYATMYGLRVVNPETVVSGRLVGTF